MCASKASSLLSFSLGSSQSSSVVVGTIFDMRLPACMYMKGLAGFGRAETRHSWLAIALIPNDSRCRQRAACLV